MHVVDRFHPIVLVNPRGELNVAVTLPAENIRLSALLAYLRYAAIPTTWIDADLEFLTAAEVAAVIAQRQVGVVVIEVLYRTLAFSRSVIDEIGLLMPAQPPLIIYTGVAPTMSPEKLLTTLPALHVIIPGEAEATLLELAHALVTGKEWRTVDGLIYRDVDGLIVRNRPRPLIADLDSLPFPARDSMPLSLHYNSTVDVATSRGCYGVCTFCNIKPFYASGKGATWRGRSPEHVVEEVDSLVRKYGTHHFAFIDEEFIGPGRAGKERARQLAELLLERDLTITFSIFCRADDIEEDLFRVLKRAGLRAVSFGLESASQRSLDYLRKHTTVAQNQAALAILRRLQIRPIPSVIMFEPTTTLPEIRDTIIFLRQHDLTNLIAPTVIIPYPGTRLTHDLRQQGLLDKTQFLLEPYIPAIHFADTRTGLLRLAWEDWERWVDDTFQDTRTLLARAYHAFVEQHEGIYPGAAKEWATALALLTNLKQMEGDVVLRMIDHFLADTFTQVVERELRSACVSSLLCIAQETREFFRQKPAVSTVLKVNPGSDCRFPASLIGIRNESSEERR